MKFLADECCDALLVAGLRSEGHDVVYVMESARGSAGKLRRLRAVLGKHASRLPQSFVVVEPGKTRFRPLHLS